MYNGFFIIQDVYASGFSSNRVFWHGGAMLLDNTYSNINGNLLLRNNHARWSGAISVVQGDFIIQGYILFDGNSAESHGGAVFIFGANFKFCASYHYGSTTAKFRGDMEDALPMPSLTFFLNSGIGGSIFCTSNSDVYVRLTGTMHFIESEGSAIICQYSNIGFVGTTHFYGNTGVNGAWGSAKYR